MDKLLKSLYDEGLSLMILKNGNRLFTSKKEGMKPLLEAMNLGLSNLKNSVVVDRIIGKSAALLIAFVKAREVHSGLISVRGREVLTQNNIVIYADRLVPEIMNKAGTDMCPFEKRVISINNPIEGYRILVKMVGGDSLITKGSNIKLNGD